MSYAETVYAQMLQMQMSAAKDAWLEAEQEKQQRAERQQQEFDRFSGVMDWLLRAQQERHKEEMDIAKMVGAGEGAAVKIGEDGKPVFGRPSGIQYGGMAGQAQQAARIASMGQLQSEIARDEMKQRIEWEQWNQRYGPGGLAELAKLSTAKGMTPIAVEKEEKMRPGKVKTSEERAGATYKYRVDASGGKPLTEYQRINLAREDVNGMYDNVISALDKSISRSDIPSKRKELEGIKSSLISAKNARVASLPSDKPVDDTVKRDIQEEILKITTSAQGANASGIKALMDAYLKSRGLK